MPTSVPRRLPRAALAAVALASVGCATVGRQIFQEPVVSFQDLRVNGIGLQGGTVDVVLSVYNPNHFALDATRLTYRLLVDSTSVGTGALDQRFVVPHGDSSTVHLPIQFTFAGLGAAGRQLLANGTVNYRVLGDVTVQTPIGSFTRPFDRPGHFSTFGGLR